MIPRRILPVIVLSQFAGTSLWFAGNAVMSGLQTDFGLSNLALGHITSAVQFGFISGTFAFALLSIADRFHPSKVFFICALLGAASNSAIAFFADGLASIVVLRFITGFFLAGIYPVGMKIASDWHKRGLGKALGYLVGALVLGTALPHLLRSLLSELHWSYLLHATSVFASLGGFLVITFIPEGPYRKTVSQLNPKAFIQVFKHQQFRRAAFGYFGHMWELYTFWAFVPMLLLYYNSTKTDLNVNISLLSFIIIASGALSCVIGGYLSNHFGSDKVSYYALCTSGICCVIVPFSMSMSPALFISFLIIWGITVIMDSPQFSTLVAGTAPKESVGTALTIVNGIGFLITIVSIQLVNLLIPKLEVANALAVLAAGPVFGVFFMRKFIASRN